MTFAEEFGPAGAQEMVYVLDAVRLPVETLPLPLGYIVIGAAGGVMVQEVAFEYDQLRVEAVLYGIVVGLVLIFVEAETNELIVTSVQGPQLLSSFDSVIIPKLPAELLSAQTLTEYVPADGKG